MAHITNGPGAKFLNSNVVNEFRKDKINLHECVFVEDNINIEFVIYERISCFFFKFCPHQLNKIFHYIKTSIQYIILKVML